MKTQGSAVWRGGIKDGRGAISTKSGALKEAPYGFASRFEGKPGSNPEELKSPEGFPKGESNKFVYEGNVGTHKWYDGTQHPWEFKRIWHLEPSLTDPDVVYAGAEDAAIFKTVDGGKTAG